MLAAVNEVEHLTTGLSRKIWQKLMILYARLPALQEGRTGTGDSANSAVGP